MRLRRLTGMSAFWLTWLGLLLSVTGSTLTRFGLSVWVFTQTRDPAAYSTLLFFATIPLAFGSLVAGPLVDRWNRRQVLIVGNIVASLPTLAIMFLFFANQLAIWHLYIALCINGIANAFIMPAFDASIRMLVPKKQLGRASGLSQMIQSLTTIIVPPLAGFMLVRFGLGSIFITDYMTVMAAVLALTMVFIPQPGSSEKPASSAWQDFVFGLRYMVQRPPFVILMAFLALVIFAQSFVHALTGPLVLTFGNEETLGLMYGVFGIGGLISTALIGVTGGPRRRMHGVLLGVMGMAIGTIIGSLRPNTLWVGSGMFVFGLSLMYMISLNRTIYQEKVAPEVLGRMFALRMAIGVGVQGAGLLLSGWLAATIFEPGMHANGTLVATFGPLLGTGEGRGAALLIFLIGVILLAVAIIAALIPSLRKLEDDLPDYVEPPQSGASALAPGVRATQR